MKRLCVFLVSVVFVGINLLQAQTVQITGTVTSAEDGMPVPGASVLVKGTSIGVATNVDGQYSISAPATATTLVFSFIGLIPQEIEIAGRTVINVVLESDVTTLEEIVVTAYGTATKQAFTGSAATISAETIERRQVSNVSKALSGAVAGVQTLSNNGQPGVSATVRIRGVGSINAGSDPLYVVDGVPFDGDLSSINSADIETMTVLKDAASTALYGARGANGIIMITTKKGSSVKSQINFDMRVGVNSRALKNYDVLTSPKNYTETVYKALYNAGVNQLGYDPIAANIYANSIITTGSSGGYGYTIYTLPEGESLIGTNGMLNPNAVLGYNDGTYYYIPDNWANETFQNNMRQEYNLSMSGGTDKQTYYLSFSNLSDLGIVPGSGYDRFSGRIKADQKLKDWLKVGANVSYNRINSQYPGSQTATTSSVNAFFVSNFIAPVYPIYVRDGETQNILMNSGRKVYDYGNGTPDGGSTNFSRSFMAIANPAGDLTYNKTNYMMDIMNTSWFAELTPLEGLTLTARYGINLDNTHYHNLGNAYMGQSASYGGTAYQQQDRTMGLNQQYIALYEFELNQDNKFDITAGYDGYSYETEFVFASGQNLYNPENYYVYNAIDNLRGGGRRNTYATKGYFGRLNYSLRETYYANIAYRRDASSRFNPENRWGDFWAASGAWILNNEAFMSDLTWVNMLKLKFSFGQQGNDAIGNYYAWLDQYQVTGADGVFSDGTLTYKGNPDLTWETSTTYNAGVDFTLFNRVLSGSVEYFGRKSTDMLYYKPVAGSLGYNSIPMNIGSMTNSGLEIDLNTNIINTQQVKVGANVNATLIKNKINELHPDLEGELIDGTRIYEEGFSMYRLYLVEWAGVDSETGRAMYWYNDEEGNRAMTHDYSTALDHKLATEDLLPRVYGGFGLNADVYGFDVSVQFAYQLGGQIYDSGYQRLMHSGISSSAGNNWHKDIYNAWTPENTETNVPRLNSQDQYANSTSTRFLVSSDYLSLNNVTVGYTLPSKVVNRLNIQKLRLYVAADNIALITARKGLDPRQSYISATTALYTPIRTVSGGIFLTF